MKNLKLKFKGLSNSKCNSSSNNNSSSNSRFYNSQSNRADLKLKQATLLLVIYLIWWEEVQQDQVFLYSSKLIPWIMEQVFLLSNTKNISSNKCLKFNRTNHRWWDLINRIRCHNNSKCSLLKWNNKKRVIFWASLIKLWKIWLIWLRVAINNNSNNQYQYQEWEWVNLELTWEAWAWVNLERTCQEWDIINSWQEWEVWILQWEWINLVQILEDRWVEWVKWELWEV